MLVTDRQETGGVDLVAVVAAAVEGGVGLVQVREKDLDDEALAALIRRLQARLGAAPVRLVVNGRPALARTLGLGLHLPASAPAPAGWRPPLLGRSVHDEAEAGRARADGVDYAVVGPVFATPSKPGHPGAGLDRLGLLCRRLAPTPVYAIGGFSPGRVEAALAAGAHGVAVRSALLGAPAPAATAFGFLRAIEAALARPGAKGATPREDDNHPARG
jgi:thiamine-phosphate diphosphorylase